MFFRQSDNVHHARARPRDVLLPANRVSDRPARLLAAQIGVSGRKYPNGEGVDRRRRIIEERRIMRTTIELPDSVYRKAEKVARTQGVTIEEFIVRAFERELKAEPDAPSHSKRVTLPLVPSKEPGTMDLKDFNFDDLLA
jgi:hypothetical protein